MTLLPAWSGDDPRRIDRLQRLRDAAAAGQPETNAIVAVELDESGPALVLVVDLLFAPAAGSISEDDILIDGGVRRPRVAVTNVVQNGARLRLQVARRGDFSDYRLAFGRDGGPLPGFDRLLSAVLFGFRRQCEQLFDCEAETPVDAEVLAEVPINYLARDYDGFRRLMLDRIAAQIPGWTEQGPADPLVTLVELLAYAADHISYAQDAAATEATLETARLRVSARRHARLVDYAMHDGANARAFVHLSMRTPSPGSVATSAEIRKNARFLTRSPGVAVAEGETDRVAAARTAGAQIFEAMATVGLTSDHNRIVLHDWQGGQTQLDKGATAATLADPDGRVMLGVGDFLLLQEVLDPLTGDASPDAGRRHVVRITAIAGGIDPVGAADATLVPQPLPIWLVRWSAADALPFALPLARVTSGDPVDGIPAGSFDQPSALARGNIVPVDAGESRPAVDLPASRHPGRRRATIALPDGPVTQAAPVPANAPASAWRGAAPRDARPAITARQDRGTGSNAAWEIVTDLMGSEAEAQHLLLEVEHGGVARLASGDGSTGAIPDSAYPFEIRARIGNGAMGNVGAGAIAHLLTAGHVDLGGNLVVSLAGQPHDIAAISNPLPASGGVDAESIADVRLKAPIAFRLPSRAVTPADYVMFLKADPLVQNVRAVERWTGSWRVIVLIVDLVGGGALDDAIEAQFRRRLEPVRLAGHALEFRTPLLVPLELAMTVCVEPEVPRDAVEERLQALFSGRRLPDGSLGLFHPDRLSFGDPIRLSRLTAAAQDVPGVRHVDITALKRRGAPGAGAAIASGSLELGALEVAVLANDANFPDRGHVALTMTGGR